jgi:1-acyl-sn-glycerol-3-phosphate acyltransferase
MTTAMQPMSADIDLPTRTAKRKTETLVRSTLRSLWVWGSVATLILIWLPLLGLIHLFDRDPVHYTTGRWFRRLGMMMTKVNPSWQLKVSGDLIENPRNPYVVVSNHQSMADIPLISNLPWEMKWVGKIELFRLPLVGWMMKLSEDIPVNRKDPRSGATMLLRAIHVLEKHCSVIFFPEGTRSPDGRVGRFNDGAFHLAVKAKVPILPIAIEGSYGCLPKKSWRFGPPQTILLRLLSPVTTAGLSVDDVPALRDRIRGMIVEQVAAFRGVSPPEVDALHGTAPATSR